MTLMRTVFSATNPVEISMAQVALRDAGVEFDVDNENSAWAMGMPMPATPVLIQVRDQDFEKAEKAIRVSMKRIHETPGPDESHKE